MQDRVGLERVVAGTDRVELKRTGQNRTEMDSRNTRNRSDRIGHDRSKTYLRNTYPDRIGPKRTQDNTETGGVG